MSTSSHDPRWVIGNANVWQHNGWRGPADIVIDGERIVAVHATMPGARTENDSYIDVNGAFISPGLIDAHVHITDDGDAAILAAHSVLLARNMADDDGRIARMGVRIRSQHRPVSDLFSCSAILDGYPPILPTSIGIRSLDAVDDVVATQIENGARCIKTYSALRPSLLRAVSDAAKRHDLPVVGHLPVVDVKDSPSDVTRRLNANDATALGLDELQHLTGVAPALGDKAPCPNLETGLAGDDLLTLSGAFSDDDIAAFARQQARTSVSHTPTLAAFFALRDVVAQLTTTTERQPDLPWHVRTLTGTPTARILVDLEANHLDAIDRGLWNRLRITKALFDAGVPLLVGTDSGVHPIRLGAAIVDEMNLWVRAGISPRDVLLAATSGNAQRLAVDGFGCIDVGCGANLVITDSDPLVDFETFNSPRAIVKWGKRVDRQVLVQNADNARHVDVGTLASDLLLAAIGRYLLNPDGLVEACRANEQLDTLK